MKNFKNCGYLLLIGLIVLGCTWHHNHQKTNLISIQIPQNPIELPLNMSEIVDTLQMYIWKRTPIILLG